MKNKSRRILSTSKKQKNKTIKKGGRSDSKKWNDWLNYIVYIYYFLKEEMPTQIGKKEINEISEFLDYDFNENEIDHLNHLYNSKIMYENEGYKHFCNNEYFAYLFKHKRDNIKHAKCSLGLKSDENFDDFILQIINTDNSDHEMNEIWRKTLNYRDIATICDYAKSSGLNKNDYERCKKRIQFIKEIVNLETILNKLVLLYYYTNGVLPKKIAKEELYKIFENSDFKECIKDLDDNKINKIQKLKFIAFNKDIMKRLNHLYQQMKMRMGKDWRNPWCDQIESEDPVHNVKCKSDNNTFDKKYLKTIIESGQLFV